MSDEKLPTVVHEQVFRVLGRDVHCYILDNGMRIVDGNDADELFEYFAKHSISMDDNRSDLPDDIRQFLAWLKGRNNS
jgi:hypothetical protein